eukprot:COSAG05_NODE_1140_length_5740_cov_11.446020_7_plen_91_part_00
MRGRRGAHSCTAEFSECHAVQLYGAAPWRCPLALPLGAALFLVYVAVVGNTSPLLYSIVIPSIGAGVSTRSFASKPPPPPAASAHLIMRA